MLSRAIILSAAAGLIVWQSGCMSFEDGKLINRCGLWQWFTGKPMVISLLDTQPLKDSFTAIPPAVSHVATAVSESITTTIVEHEKVIDHYIYVDRPVPAPAPPPVVIYQQVPVPVPCQAGIASGAFIATAATAMMLSFDNYGCRP
jgi:hypothetical protein